jgi:hypothetical protein
LNCWLLAEWRAVPHLNRFSSSWQLSGLKWTKQSYICWKEEYRQLSNIQRCVCGGGGTVQGGAIAVGGGGS